MWFEVFEVNSEDFIRLERRKTWWGAVTVVTAQRKTKQTNFTKFYLQSLCKNKKSRQQIFTSVLILLNELENQPCHEFLSCFNKLPVLRGHIVHLVSKRNFMHSSSSKSWILNNAKQILISQFLELRNSWPARVIAIISFGQIIPFFAGKTSRRAQRLK